MTGNAPSEGTPIDDHAATPEEFREQIESTREELAQTVPVQTAAAETEGKARAQDKVASMAHAAREKAAEATADAQETATGVLHLVQDKVPEPVRHTAAAAKAQLAETTAAVTEKVQEKTRPSVRAKVAGAADAVRRHLPTVAIVAGSGVIALAARISRRNR